jgi:coenzyme F420-0:L-glutamate ligase
MNVHPVKTRVFKEGEDLEAFIVEHVPAIADGTVLVVTSKIVALAEGRTGAVEDREKIIEAESEFVLRTKHTWLTIKDGTIMASAGVDESNGDGKLVLLPKDSFAAAEKLRAELIARYDLRNLGVVITDSRLLPLRAGIVGVALGYAGFKGVRDYRGTPDIFGRELKLARTDIADGLATAAVLEMGEGAEQQPLGVITDAPVEYVETVERDELHIDIEDDLYKPLFDTLK